MNEDDVIDGVISYLKDKHSSPGRKFIIDYRARARDGDHGIDLRGHATSNGIISNRYYVEAKGTLTASNNSKKSSDFMTEFRWAVSQIVLKMKEVNAAANYAIAIPKAEESRCLKLMAKSNGLKTLRVRLFLAYKKPNGEYYAEEMTPSKIYGKQ